MAKPHHHKHRLRFTVSAARDLCVVLCVLCVVERDLCVGLRMLPVKALSTLCFVVQLVF